MPPPLHAAVFLALVPVALYLVGAVIAMVSGQEVSVGAVILGILLTLGPGVLLVWLARAGHWWARAIFSVGSAVVIVGIVIGTVTMWTGTDRPESWVVRIAATIGSLLLVAAPVVLLWLPTSNAYFRAVAVEKRQFRESTLR